MTTTIIILPEDDPAYYEPYEPIPDYADEHYHAHVHRPCGVEGALWDLFIGRDIDMLDLRDEDIPADLLVEVKAMAGWYAEHITEFIRLRAIRAQRTAHFWPEHERALDRAAHAEIKYQRGLQYPW